jgi:hypothetical protein
MMSITNKIKTRYKMKKVTIYQVDAETYKYGMTKSICLGFTRTLKEAETKAEVYRMECESFDIEVNFTITPELLSEEQADYRINA